jgi:hypothetical protein
MVMIDFHLGLRQAVMALMHWAIDVPQKLLQSEAKPFLITLKPMLISSLGWGNNKKGKKE